MHSCRVCIEFRAHSALNFTICRVDVERLLVRRHRDRAVRCKIALTTSMLLKFKAGVFVAQTLPNRFQLSGNLNYKRLQN